MEKTKMKDNNSGRYDILLQDSIDALLSRTKVETTKLHNELKNLHGGTLYTKKYKSNSIFVEYFNGQQRSIGKNKERVHMLARRKYLSAMSKTLSSSYKLLKQLSKELRNLNCSNNLDAITSSFEAFGLDIDRILLSPHQRKWLAQPYERNPAYTEELKFHTTNDVLMRTKSEVLIANRLEYYRIPYLPEKPLWFDYDTHPKYPDFTILKPNGEIIIWEHMGRMDKEDYFIKNSKKIVEYRQNGYSQNTNLIITFEEDISEPGIIDHIIKTRILS